VARARLGPESVVAGPGEIHRRVVARAMVVASGGVAEIRPRIDGRVLAVHAREGDVVTEGQLLAELDGSETKAELQRLEAEHRALEQTVAAVAEGMRPAERRALAAEAEAAAAELAWAEDQARRQHELFAQGNEAETRTRELDKSVDVARARVAVSAAKLDLARGGGRPADVAAARERVAAAAAAIERARAHLAHTRVLAPMAGVVLSRRVDPGDTVHAMPTSSGGPMFEIADPTHTEIRLEVEEPDARAISPGLEVVVQSLGGREPLARGELSRLSARVERRTIAADDARVRADGWVRPAWATFGTGEGVGLPIGMQVEAVVRLPATQVEVRVPRDAVRIHEGRAWVTVPGLLLPRERAVLLGAADENWVEVRELGAGTVVLRE
jgi:multidrug efflux pump subunit AcrA (membrane-fusion protein)